MTQDELFLKSKRKIQDLIKANPIDEVWLKSILDQVEYLIQLKNGDTHDRSLLKKINIGILAVRVVEPIDMQTAKMLYEVADEARRM